ncbi:MULTISPECIES: cyclic nucleotide-binding domain-containing protein [unclassified Myxococcus]|uniref:cyclic nucleotide-binding domain-containing protein n=1 Tax=unclassified Myxococcus TaxID=2648731 RepID=UPI00157AD79C|nr:MULTISPECIES: cyclic nucleotide-binding domain-containing protein [unclassified Myxococcus]NTX40863.1 cyclic nucleotide-binding domain-containing protein [Myxococcus sp. CA033]NTX50454.1 cyclic nucleotide-binding domain-containing protein [Myxococcus sp. CA039A]
MADMRGVGKARAVELASQGKLEEALGEYQGLLKSSPDDADVRQRVAELLEWLGRTADAAAAHETAALAWAKVEEPLRAVAACVALSRLGASDAAKLRCARALAERFAHCPGVVAERPVPLFSRLSREDFVALVGVLEVRAFFPGQSVVEEGAAGASMFALVEGRAEVVRALEDGARGVVGTVVPGDFFGELALVSEGPRLASVVATERAVLLELTRASLTAVAVRHPGVGEVLEDFYRRRLVDNLLRSNPLLSRLTAEQKAALSHDFMLRAVAPDEVLLAQGQPGDAFYVLLRGRCTPWLEQPGGRRMPLTELREGDVFGEISLLLDKPVSATVRADVKGVVLRLPRAAFEKHLLSQPGMKGLLMRMGTERLQNSARVLASGRVLHDGDLRV